MNKNFLILIILVFVFSFLFSSEARAANLEVGLGKAYVTIQACATEAAVGDTCLVSAGAYDERVTVANSGIIFKAAPGTKPKVRGFTATGKSNITIDGFEITHSGMTSDYLSSVSISGGTGAKVLNNYIHDTRSACVGFGNLSFMEISGNTIDHCGVAKAIIGAPTNNSFQIDTSKNMVKIKLNGGVSYTTTLTTGTLTLADVCSQINAGAGGLFTCTAVGAKRQVHIYPTIFGPATSVELENIESSAYGTLGLTVGGEVFISHAAAFQGLYQQPTSDVLIEQNQVSRVSDFLIPLGSKFVYRNNILGPSDLGTAVHIDGIQSNGPADFILIEGNTHIDNVSSDNHFLISSAASNNWIIRYNTSLRSKGGQIWGCQCGTTGKWAHYNNTWYDNFAYAPSWNQMILTNIVNNVSRNNIWYRSVYNPGGKPYFVGAGSSLDMDYDLLFESGTYAGSHVVTSDPQFVGASSGNFNLQSSSPAINAGGSLTATTNSGTNSTSLEVTNASPFQPGWAGTSPDKISVGTTGNVSQISSINYGSNTITLSSPLSWSSGAPVYLHSNSSGTQVLYGSAPDIGAFEYNSGGVQPPPPPPPPPPVDITAPVLSSISAYVLTQSSVSISFTTDEPSDTQIDYGLTTSYGSQTTLNG